MCLTTEALVLFINLIGVELVSQEPGRIIVHATSADVHWVVSGEDPDRWCTMAPQLDRQARFSAKG